MIEFFLKFLSLIFLCFFNIHVKACDCNPLPPLTSEVVGQSEYIGLVKTKTILPVPDSIKVFGNTTTPYFLIIVEEITNYKGKVSKQLLVSGGHSKFNIFTSCDIGINENEEWLVYANNQDGYLRIGFCGRSKLYRDNDGLYAWRSSVINELNWLNNFFNKPVVNSSVINGKSIINFPNGKIARVENYKRGKLNGTVEYFFPNGNRYGIRGYKNGVLHGKETWYDVEGVKKSTSQYRNGIIVDSSISFQNCLDSLIVPRFIAIYTKGGKIKKKVEYQNCDEGDFEIVSEKIYKGETEYYFTYYANGKLHLTGKTVQGKQVGTHVEYDERGMIKKQWKYDDNGKIINN